VVICSYNDHVRLLSPSLLVGFSTTKVYSGIGADIVMESISLKSPHVRQMSVMMLQQLSAMVLHRAIPGTVICQAVRSSHVWPVT
jgi:hypothetical protein